MQLSNWGNYPSIETTLYTPRQIQDVEVLAHETSSLVARGLGRCYGDSALHPACVLSTERLDRFLSFDEGTGLLTAEAGVSLAEIIHCFAPRGWFVPVTPGTSFVTLGGAFASDVHGKNHHVAGTFGQHVDWVDVITAERGIVRCSPSEHADLFHATRGGHGLTGIIVRVAVRMVRIPSLWIRQTSLKTTSLAETMDAFEQCAAAPFSVAWIDCLKQGQTLGRSILMYGDFASPESLPRQTDAFRQPSPKRLSVPFNAPSIALNPLSVRAFNTLYYGKSPRASSDSLVSCSTFFHPLDAVLHWNRIYGKRGFTQYQFVIPKEAGREGLHKVLQRIAASGLGSFLAVLKLFGAQETAPGNISFPTEGYTLALDFPVSDKLFPLLDELDHMVLDYGGRHYLTKDARMSATTMRQGYGTALDTFLDVKRAWDPTNRFTSVQATRLNLI